MLINCCGNVFTFHCLAMAPSIHSTVLAFICPFAIFKSTEQCICIKFCKELWEMDTELWRLVQVAFGGATRSQTWDFNWALHFKEEQIVIISDRHPRHAPASRKDESVVSSAWFSLKWRKTDSVKMAEEVGIFYVFLQAILTIDFGLEHVLPKFVPWLLTQE